MIEVMNFFQTMFVFKTNPPALRLNAAEVNLAAALHSEALELRAIAEQEMHNGATTQALSLAEKDHQKSRIFAEIAVWHHQRAAAKYDNAADRFDEAGRVRKNRALHTEAREMRQHAGCAAAAVKTLNDFLMEN